MAVWSSARLYMGHASLGLRGKRMVIADGDASRGGATRRQEARLAPDGFACGPPHAGFHRNGVGKEIGPHCFTEQGGKRGNVRLPFDQRRGGTKTFLRR